MRLKDNKLVQIIVLILIFGAIYLYDNLTLQQNSNFQIGDDALFNAISEKRSDVIVEGIGNVVKILADDTQGSQHQRFLVKLSNDHVILIAHNIDLAPRIDALKEGDTIRFKGEFEWNDKGGVVHWTHHDPNGSHPGGWLEHNGSRFE